jgi:hypothetical protein
MRALHPFDRLTERRSLRTQLSHRRYSGVGGFNTRTRIAFRQTKKAR